jgi:hypothetical protein
MYAYTCWGPFGTKRTAQTFRTRTTMRTSQTGRAIADDAWETRVAVRNLTSHPRRHRPRPMSPPSRHSQQSLSPEHITSPCTLGAGTAPTSSNTSPFTSYPAAQNTTYYRIRNPSGVIKQLDITQILLHVSLCFSESDQSLCMYHS